MDSKRRFYDVIIKIVKCNKKRSDRSDVRLISSRCPLNLLQFYSSEFKTVMLGPVYI